MEALKTELATYEAKHAELLAASPGKTVVIKGASVLGVFDTQEEALGAAARAVGLQNVLVRKIERTPQVVSAPALTLGLLGADPPSAVHR
jgi:hypothetical protein